MPLSWSFARSLLPRLRVASFGLVTVLMRSGPIVALSLPPKVDRFRLKGPGLRSFFN